MWRLGHVASVCKALCTGPTTGLLLLFLLDASRMQEGFERSTCTAHVCTAHYHPYIWEQSYVISTPDMTSSRVLASSTPVGFVCSKYGRVCMDFRAPRTSLE